MINDIRIRVNIHKIADNFSKKDVLEHTCEEFAEASAALIQYARAFNHKKDTVYIRERESHMLEEVADALVMLEQVFHKNPYMRGQVDNWMKRKVERTFNRYKLEDMHPMEDK